MENVICKWLIVLFPILQFYTLSSKTNNENYIIQQYTTKDGLASNYVYHSTQDNNGYIWFATENGVSRFNGKQFKHLSMQNGLRSNQCLGSLNIGGIIYIYSYYGLDFIQSNLTVVNDKYKDLNVTNAINHFSTALVNGKIYISNIDSIFIFNALTKKLILKKQTRYAVVNSAQKIKQHYESGIKLVNKRDSIGSYLVYKNSIYKNYNDLKKVRPFYTPNNTINSAIEIQNGNLIVSTNSGLLIVDKDKKITDTLLTDIFINTCYEAADGNIWACSKNDGVFLIKKSKFFSSQILTVNNPNYSNSLPKSHKKNEYFLKNLSAIKFIENINDTQLILCYYNKAVIYSLNLNAETKIINSTKTYCSLSLNDGTTYLGTDEGVLILKNFKIYQKLKFPNTTNSINLLYKDKEGNLWIGILGSGIYKSHLNFKKITKFNKDNHLLSNNVLKVIEDNRGKIYLLTELGFSVVKGNDWICNATYSDGYPTGEIIDSKIKNDTLYLHQEKFMYKYFLDTEYLKPEPLSFNIEFCKLGSDMHYQLPDYVKPEDNNIEINYNSIYFDNPNEIVYRYCLRTPEKPRIWSITKDEYLHFTSLKGGDYIFEIQAYNSYKPNLKSKVLRWKFYVGSHFYETWWFYLLVGIFIISIIVGLMYYKNRLRFEKLTMESELVKTKLHSLQNQMNPHFIFNSLTTIQQFIYSNDKRNAFDYISDFSSLIRQMLENSKVEMISFAEEINFLKKYIEVELIRFNQKFDVVFDINIDEDIEEILIPTMLIQPLIENAIKHGVACMNDKRGVIRISAYIDNDLLNLKIYNDKPNFNPQNQKSSNHNSSAMNIIKKRIDLYSFNGKKCKFDFTINSTFAIVDMQIPI